jgi:serine/threonine-protein kinase
MARVFLAQDLRDSRVVALKVLKRELAEAVAAERFRQEIDILSHLDHPNILPLLCAERAGVFLYYVMPYASGGSLRGLISREGHRTVEDALATITQLAEGVAHAHARGIIHRDIKPENVLFEDGRALLGDFGVAKALDIAGGKKLTETGFIVGTPTYMSPEQALNEAVDGRTDIYALGCVLFEMLAGQPPFTGHSTQAILARHAVDPVPKIRTFRPDLPSRLERVLITALAKKPKDRFSSVEYLVDELTAH